MPVSPVSTATSSAPSTTSPISDNADLSSEFNQFLELLTTQVQNQDPFQPLDSTQFVEQLATFSALEQQVQSNDLLKKILTALDGSGNG